MSNDLISRAALKKAIKTECNPYGKPTIDFGSGKKVLKLIDNAQAVDINTELSVAYLKGRRQGQSEERPQGEWIFDGKEWRCNKCSFTPWYFRSPMYSEYNFCPNCGADMRR